ncbi:unnamed protein product [Fusarium graminearum]|nr:unnamed protein product [Fusarium graminearum]
MARSMGQLIDNDNNIGNIGNIGKAMQRRQYRNVTATTISYYTSLLFVRRTITTAGAQVTKFTHSPLMKQNADTDSK